MSTTLVLRTQMDIHKNVPSVLRPVSQREGLPIPTPPQNWDDTNTSHLGDSDDTQTDENVEPFENNCDSI